MLVLRLSARFPLRFLIALVLGALHACGFLADSAWPLQVVALAALLAAGRPTAGRPPDPWVEARAGFAFGLAWFLSGTYWTYVSMHTYGGMPGPIAAAATLALCAYMALYPALACGVWAGLTARRDLSPARSLLLVFPACWMVAEWLRGVVLTGHPWLASGYAHIASPLAGYAPLLGVYGVGLAAALCAGALVLLGARPHRPGRTRLAVLTLAAVLAGGQLLRQPAWSEPAGAPLQARLLQGNIDQELKFVPGRFEATVRTYLDLVTARPADLIVLPETALPRFLHNLPPNVLDRLQDWARTSHSSIAFGVPLAEGGAYYNSVVALTPDGAPLQRYDKHHLVPFGEFIPWGFRWFVNLMHIPLGDFARGRGDAPPLRLAGHAVAFNICYEDLFGAEIARQAVDADILVNVSNVAWFGDTLALPQHLQAARMRALETARPMLRATNTGMTAAIDARGVVQAVLPAFTVGALDVQVQGTRGATPYLWWRDGGVLVAGALLLAGALAGGRAGGRREVAGNALTRRRSPTRETA